MEERIDDGNIILILVDNFSFNQSAGNIYLPTDGDFNEIF